MCPRKKRARYKRSAEQIAIDKGLSLPQTWEEVWTLLDKYGEVVYVYLIGSKELPTRVKIGKSVNPWTRLKALQTGFPLKLELYFCSISHDEREVHEKFKHLRVSGEWFEYTDEIKKYFNIP